MARYESDLYDARPNYMDGEGGRDKECRDGVVSAFWLVTVAVDTVFY